MNTNRTKLITAALTLLLSIAMLAGASFAWFTLSTAPEVTGIQVSLYTDLDLLVSKTADGEFTQSISTENREKPLMDTSIDNLKFYAGLRPISTVDGVNWFLPSYQANGTLTPAEEFTLAGEDNANVVLWEEEDGQYTYALVEGSNAYFTKENKSYYMYADIWLKTENENGVVVTLSTPNISEGQAHNENNSMQAWELGDGSDYSEAHGRKYGSYALAKYAPVGDDILSIDNNVQTALRVGFLTEDEGFVIYEPNADQRSIATYKPKKDTPTLGEEEDSDQILDESVYVLGYAMEHDGSNYQTGYYIPTQPIGLVDNPDPEGPAQIPGMVTIPQDRLLVQMQSKWNEENIKKNFAHPTSADVGHFGKFVADNATTLDSTAPTQMGTGLALASNNKILTLEKDTPKRVRIFFWLEGQDVDCWNDIASGSFLVNLEFAATELPPRENSGENTNAEE